MNDDRLAPIARSERASFDYMEFLSASCKKHWRFVDAIYGVMPIFGMVLKSRQPHARTRKEQLRELALQVVSTQVSDETNIVRLITLAGQQGLSEVYIQLPYALTLKQLQSIREELKSDLQLTQQGECLEVVFSNSPH